MNSFNELYNSFKLISKNLQFGNVTHLGNDTKEVNSSNDIVKNIDNLANHTIVNSLKKIENVIGYVSEEEEQLVIFDKYKDHKNGYIVIFDPLDGSKNVYSNISCGTIYGIYNYDLEEDGIIDIVETGYCLYGPSTILVKTENNEAVKMYTLDSSNQFKFINNIELSRKNSIYSINMSYEYDQDVKYFVSLMKSKECTQRWCGAMVADVHQILMRGGTFVYPSTINMPRGKIRLLYEALPMAYIFTLLNGTAVDVNNSPLLNKIQYVRLLNKDVHGETPVILSTHYSRKELGNIFEINDIIKC